MCAVVQAPQRATGADLDGDVEALLCGDGYGYGDITLVRWAR